MEYHILSMRKSYKLHLNSLVSGNKIKYILAYRPTVINSLYKMLYATAGINEEA